jgi:nucleotide-binding universal stress UspA family protein
VTTPGPGTFERGTDGPRILLVGIDGSPTSLRAAAYAAGLARRQRSRLVAAYIAAPASTWAAQLPDVVALQTRANSELATELAAQVAEGAEHVGVRVDFVTRDGDPFTELSRIADELPADCVFVGASEQGVHRLIGSLAVRLVRTGRWPVTVVP